VPRDARRSRAAGDREALASSVDRRAAERATAAGEAGSAARAARPTGLGGASPQAAAVAALGDLALASLAAAAGTLAVALLAAAVFPDESLIGRAGEDVSLLTEAFRHVVQIQLVSVYEVSLPGEPSRVAPALLAGVPVVACALAVAWRTGRGRSWSPPARLLLGAATGLPFALLVLLCARLAGSDEEFVAPSAAAFLAALAWGALGGILGALVGLRREARRRQRRREVLEGEEGADGRARAGAPARGGDGGSTDPAATALDLLGRLLRPLAVLLAIAALAGAAAWIARATISAENSSDDRSPRLAMVEDSLYVIEHGVHLVELGAFVLFEPPVVELEILGVPFPPDAPEDLAASLERYRMFAYRQTLPPALFAALLVASTGLTAALALYAGFSAARGRRPRDLLRGAGWGALAGPAWALALLALDALIDKPVFGRAVGSSVVISLLLLVTPLGALGGALATRIPDPPPWRGRLPRRPRLPRRGDAKESPERSPT
jgi:hypothetical protein